MKKETYKGIEFVRIADLPEEQKKQFSATFDHSKIIKILREKELLNDCIQVSDYINWVGEKFVSATPHTGVNSTAVAELVAALSR